MKMNKLLLSVCFSLLALTGNAALAKGEAPAVYLDAAQLDSTRFMAPPPPAEVAGKEIELMLELQRLRTPEQAARSVADLEQSVFRFANVMGPKFTEQGLPLVAAFFKRLYKTESGFNKQGKELWKRERPPVVDKRLQPVAKYSHSGSYPSGHAAFGFLTGMALADMVPEWRPQILARAREFGDNRVLGGVHYPSDVEAGRQLAVLIAALAPQNPSYRADFEAAKAELRRVLELP
ncbi:phosphatase PAP2 family protein [Acidovorax sp. sif1233]|uniref:acid phosphatase n=1 Tax=Acidovorax sp. sif1233 TaxID=2854792 RepID=UPI001C4559BB|nr:phosphatase PAP2 family protein [Acidovorax sp. sif1233]MBV7455258.1 phosphatase PAP2 family protein [Acidovorax sp. sif1233]